MFKAIRFFLKHIEKSSEYIKVYFKIILIILYIYKWLKYGSVLSTYMNQLWFQLNKVHLVELNKLFVMILEQEILKHFIEKHGWILYRQDIS